MRLQRWVLLLALIILLSWLASAADQSENWVPNIPTVWDESALSDWPTPVAGLNIRPTHISSKEYYSLPVENFRSYPVYMPGREPEGYWEMLQHIGPRPLIEPDMLKTEADWIQAGQRVFDEAYAPQLRTLDPKLISQIRS